MTNLKSSQKNRRFLKSHFGFESKVHQGQLCKKKNTSPFEHVVSRSQECVCVCVCVCMRNVVSVLMHTINV